MRFSISDIIKIDIFMKKRVKLKYDKQKIFDAYLKFLKSNKKIILIEYKGKELNSFYGITKDLEEVKIPLRFRISFLFKYNIQKYIIRLINQLHGGEFKNKVYRLFGAKIGKEVRICEGANIDESFLDLIKIGDGSIIGSDVKILAHEVTIKHLRFGRVNIGKQVVVGTNSIIRGGVSIGDGAVIAMDSLVNKDIPAREEWGGIPAHKIKKLRKLI
ncbi:MAG: acyltransferase [Nanoarchaeota archaeon]|nr:acyltransferase [Nanoarchaeota archaeon]